MIKKDQQNSKFEKDLTGNLLKFGKENLRKTSFLIYSVHFRHSRS